LVVVVAVVVMAWSELGITRRVQSTQTLQLHATVYLMSVHCAHRAACIPELAC
jgi:hypothetical protein